MGRTAVTSFSLGIDVGGSKIAASLLDEAGAYRHTRTVATAGSVVPPAPNTTTPETTTTCGATPNEPDATPPANSNDSAGRSHSPPLRHQPDL